MFKGNELKYYIELAKKIETMNELSQDTFLMDQLIDSSDMIDPFGYETLDGLDILKIDHRAYQQTNPMVINFLEALKSKATLESFIKDLRQHSYTDAQVEDFKAYPLLNNEEFISAKHKTHIIHMIDFKTVDPAQVKTSLLLERYQVKNPIVAKLIQLKYELSLRYYNANEYLYRRNEYIASLTETDDEALLHSIATCPLFNDTYLSKDLQKHILFKLVSGLEYSKLSRNPHRSALIKALDFNPMTMMVFKAYLEGTNINDLLKTFKPGTFTNEEVVEFSKNKLFEIPGFYSKKDQLQIIFQAMHGKVERNTFKVDHKLKNLDNYRDFFLGSQALIKSYLAPAVELTNYQAQVNHLESMQDRNFLSEKRASYLKKIIFKMNTYGVKSSNLRKLIDLNKSIIKDFLANQANYIQYNAFLYMKGFDFLSHETLMSHFEHFNKMLEDFKPYRNAILNNDKVVIFKNDSDDGHTTTSPLTVSSDASNIPAKEDSDTYISSGSSGLFGSATSSSDEENNLPTYSL